MGRARTAGGALPGFTLTLGVTVTFVSLLVVLPLGALVLKAAAVPFAKIVSSVTGARALAALRLSFGAAAGAAALNVVIGVLVAWVLVRYRFPGRALLDALLDVPFALPTAVAGIALTSVWSESGWLGRGAAALGWKVAFARPGVVLALVFVGLPFVVRTVQPVMQELDPAREEAAAVLGAGRLYTFVHVILPSLAPALVTGFGLAFARALGEYGSVVFISGNMPKKTEIVPLLIVTKLEQFDYAGATAIAVVMLAASFLVLIALGALESRTRRGQAR